MRNGNGTVIKKVAGLDPEQQIPFVFADRIIRQLVDHMVGEDTVTEDIDFLSIRQLYKIRKGSWEAFLNGDPSHNNLLKDIVVAWSKTPAGKKKKPETL